MSSRSNKSSTSNSSSSSKSKSSTTTSSNIQRDPVIASSAKNLFDPAPQNPRSYLDKYEKGQKLDDRKVQALKPTTMARGTREESPVSIFQLDDIDGHPDPAERDNPENQLVFKTKKSPQPPSWLSRGGSGRSEEGGYGGGGGSGGGSGSGSSGRKK